MTFTQPRWRMVYQNFNGVNLGEVLDSHDRQFSFNLLSPNSIQFTQEIVSSQVANFLTQKEGYILLYRNNTLAMTAEIASIEVSGSDAGDHAFTVNCMETMHTRLTKRLVGKSTQGLAGPTTAYDQGSFLMDNLDTLNAVNSTSLVQGTTTPSGTITGGVWRYKPFMELMQELSATVAGFDFYQRPRDPSGTGSSPGITGAIDIKPVIGTTQQDVVFEYGVGAANARAYQWLIHNESIINRAIVLPPEFPDNAGNKVSTVSDLGSSIIRGIREEVIPSDLSSLTLRNQLANLHVSLRKAPREQFIIQPASVDGSQRVPQFLEDYNVGDMIRGRVQDQSILMLDAMVRIYGVTVTMSDEGQETVDLNLINDGAATA